MSATFQARIPESNGGFPNYIMLSFSARRPLRFRNSMCRPTAVGSSPPPLSPGACTSRSGLLLNLFCCCILTLLSVFRPQLCKNKRCLAAFAGPVSGRSFPFCGLFLAHHSPRANVPWLPLLVLFPANPGRFGVCIWCTSCILPFETILVHTQKNLAKNSLWFSGRSLPFWVSIFGAPLGSFRSRQIRCTTRQEQSFLAPFAGLVLGQSWPFWVSILFLVHHLCPSVRNKFGAQLAPRTLCQEQPVVFQPIFAFLVVYFCISTRPVMQEDGLSSPQSTASVIVMLLTVLRLVFPWPLPVSFSAFIGFSPAFACQFFGMFRFFVPAFAFACAFAGLSFRPSLPCSFPSCFGLCF
mmetsp:Transcript_16706/g.28946  ORF Transcript_16706/g.28946 Transcript_16706/m.28946 type:complete len:353 (-) Transcript_16706:272-1330(-)